MKLVGERTFTFLFNKQINFTKQIEKLKGKMLKVNNVHIKFL